MQRIHVPGGSCPHGEVGPADTASRIACRDSQGWLDVAGAPAARSGRGVSSWIALAAAIAFAPPLSGCGDAASGADDLVTYVCTETRAVVRAKPQPTPAIHPETGRRTLVRGMYCAQCDAWSPIPAEARHPQAIRCGRHGETMSLTGPEPAASQSAQPRQPGAPTAGGR